MVIHKRAKRYPGPWATISWQFVKGYAGAEQVKQRTCKLNRCLYCPVDFVLAFAAHACRARSEARVSTLSTHRKLVGALQTHHSHRSGVFAKIPASQNPSRVDPGAVSSPQTHIVPTTSGKDCLQYPWDTKAGGTEKAQKRPRPLASTGPGESTPLGTGGTTAVSERGLSLIGNTSRTEIFWPSKPLMSAIANPSLKYDILVAGQSVGYAQAVAVASIVLTSGLFAEI